VKRLEDLERTARRRNLATLKLPPEVRQAIRRGRSVRRALDRHTAASSLLRDERRELCKRLKDDLSLGELSELFGVEPSYIARLLKSGLA
jgi:AraC-like DNA-binding protein